MVTRSCFVAIAIAAITVLPPYAAAQSYRYDSGGYSSPSYNGGTNYYDSSGMQAGSSSVDSFGNTNYYDSSGMYSGRSANNAFGNTNHYGQNGMPNGYTNQDQFGNYQHYDSNGMPSGSSSFGFGKIVTVIGGAALLYGAKQFGIMG